MSWVDSVVIVVRPASLSSAWRPRVELLGRRSPRWAGSPPTSLSADEPEPAVERGVLDALGHHRAAGLLEPHDELVGGAAPSAGCARPSARSHDQRRACSCRSLGAARAPGRARRPSTHGRGCSAAPARRARRRRGSGPSRRAARLERLGAAAPGRGRAAEVPWQIAAALDEPVDLGVQARARRRSRLASLDDRRRSPPARRCSSVEQVGRAASAPAGSTKQPADAQQGVVAGRAGARPVVGQLLVALEDLLDDDPGAAGRVGQPLEVAARVGEAVGVVDPQPVDRAVARCSVEQQRVGRVEDLGVLDPHRDQRVDVEEAPVVQLLVRRPASDASR